MSTPTADEVKELIVSELSELADLKPEEITDDATLEDLDIDSLDLVELAQIIEERYEVRLERDDFKDVTTVGGAVEAIVNRCLNVPA
ncbi:MAG TPA: phosphopantetheine-binding protein [Solirubrobacterales bacterium]|nr:phosphopantetheine-binding protein [Solirubrobacterales bacterium]